MAHKPTKKLEKLSMSLGQIDVSSNVLKALLTLDSRRNKTEVEEELCTAITKYLQSLNILDADGSYTDFVFPKKLDAVMEEYC